MGKAFFAFPYIGILKNHYTTGRRPLTIPGFAGIRRKPGRIYSCENKASAENPVFPRRPCLAIFRFGTLGVSGDEPGAAGGCLNGTGNLTLLAPATDGIAGISPDFGRFFGIHIAG